MTSNFLWRHNGCHRSVISWKRTWIWSVSVAQQHLWQGKCQERWLIVKWRSSPDYWLGGQHTNILRLVNWTVWVACTEPNLLTCTHTHVLNSWLWFGTCLYCGVEQMQQGAWWVTTWAYIKMNRADSTERLSLLSLGMLQLTVNVDCCKWSSTPTIHIFL